MTTKFSKDARAGGFVTFPEWCELMGTSVFEMAGAQELAEAEDWEQWIIDAAAAENEEQT